MKPLLMLVVCLFVSCNSPIPQPIRPPVVRASDLAESFRLAPETARDAYKGQRIIIRMEFYVVRDQEIHWHLGSDKSPAVVVCRIGPVEIPKGVIWIDGLCEGKITDRAVREIAGYDFHVLISDCRVVPTPRQAP